MLSAQLGPPSQTQAASSPLDGRDSWLGHPDSSYGHPPAAKPYRSGRERRQAPRVEIQLLIAYKNLDQFFLDYTRNISEGGLFIESRFPLEPGTQISLRFELPGLGDGLEVQGEVVRSISPLAASEHGSRPGMGIRFGALPEAARLRINALVSEQSDGEGTDP